MLLQLSLLCWYLPLLRAFQWGTLWLCTLSGIKKWQVKVATSKLLNENWAFIIDLLYFDIPLRYRVMHYLIRKLYVMANMRQKGQVVVALLRSVMRSWNVPIYYKSKWGFVKTQSLRTVLDIIDSIVTTYYTYWKKWHNVSSVSTICTIQKFHVNTIPHFNTSLHVL